MTVEAGLTPGGRRIEIARAAELTFGMLRQDFARDYALAIGIAVVPMLLNVLLVQSRMAVVQTAGVGMAHHNPFGPVFLLIGFLSLIATVLIYASLSWGSAERLQGRTPSLGEKMTAAFRALPVLIGVTILAYIALVLATLLLVAPAIFLGVCWSVVAPAVTVERLGVFSGFGRSFELTRNNRWAILGLLLIYWVVSIIVSLLGGVLVRAVFGVTGGVFSLAPMGGLAVWASFLVSLLIGGVVNTVGAVGVGVVYSELRGAQGGFDARRLGEVFA